MKVVFKKYLPSEQIPVQEHLKNRKLAKYFSRETAAALVCVSELINGTDIGPFTPIYYATGMMEYDEFGLSHIIGESIDDQQRFSQDQFVNRGMSVISPLTQFKVLYNMTLCFISIEYQLQGENAVIYESAAGLYRYCSLIHQEGVVLFGAGKLLGDGTVESGFVLATSDEIASVARPPDEMEAIHWMYKLYQDSV